MHVSAIYNKIAFVNSDAISTKLTTLESVVREVQEKYKIYSGWSQIWNQRMLSLKLWSKFTAAEDLYSVSDNKTLYYTLL